MKSIEKQGPGTNRKNLRRLVNRRNILLAMGIGAGSLALAPLVLQRFQDTSSEVLRKGQQLNRERKYPEAVKEFTRVIESRKDFAGAYLFRGIALFNSGQFDEAIGDFSQVLNLDPQNIPVYLYRGESYLATGKIEEAIEDFMAVVKANPSDKRLIAAANAKLQAIGR